MPQCKYCLLCWPSMGQPAHACEFGCHSACLDGQNKSVQSRGTHRDLIVLSLPPSRLSLALHGVSGLRWLRLHVSPKPFPEDMVHTGAASPECLLDHSTRTHPNPLIAPLIRLALRDVGTPGKASRREGLVRCLFRPSRLGLAAHHPGRSSDTSASKGAIWT
jgi:hypothetical protein